MELENLQKALQQNLYSFHTIFIKKNQNIPSRVTTPVNDHAPVVDYLSEKRKN